MACFRETSKKDFGFVPLQGYLQFERETKSQSVTPRSEMGNKSLTMSRSATGVAAAADKSFDET